MRQYRLPDSYQLDVLLSRHMAQSRFVNSLTVHFGRSNDPKTCNGQIEGWIMRYMLLAAVAWLFVLDFSPAAASDDEGLRLDTGIALPGIEQFSMGEELPHYWKNWRKESALAQNVGADLRNRKEEAIEGPKKSEPGMVRSEENYAKELTLSDIGFGALKVVGTVILAPFVVVGYVGFFFIEGTIREGGSYGFD